MSGAKRTARDYAFVAAGKIASLASLLAGAIVVARLAGKSEFGLYNTALALTLLLDGGLGSPLDSTAVRFAALHAGEPKRVLRFQAATFRIKAAIAVILGLVAALAHTWITQTFFHDRERAALLFAAVVCVAALLLARSSAAFIQSQQRFRAYSLFDGALAAARLAALALVGVAGARRAETYLYAQGLATLLIFLAGLICISQPYILARWPSRTDARALLTFLGAIAAVIALGTITGRADVPILALRQTADRVGEYAAGAQIAAAATLLAGYAAVIVQPRLIQMIRCGALVRAVVANVSIAAVVGMGGAAAAIWIVPWLVPALFGDTYAAAIPVLQILVIGTILDLLFMPVPMTYALQLRPRASAIGETIITAAFLAVAPFAAREGLLAMAWLATGVRLMKCALYFALTLGDLHNAQTRARTLSETAAPAVNMANIEALAE